MYGVVDCNNFYASCERIFQPKLEKIPVVVLSNNDGCVVSRTQEVKDLGVPMGAAAFKYKDLFQRYNVQVFSSNFPLYADISSRIMKIVAEMMPTVEFYSIDEAFFTLSGYSKSYIYDQSVLLRSTILKSVGMPVSIGIADTKTLSKIANEVAKKRKNYNGVCIIDSEEKRIKLLQSLEVSDVWGIGRQLTKRLNDCGIYNAYQLSECDDSWVRQELTLSGLKTVKELRGVTCIDLEADRPAKKSIISSKSFGHSVTELKDMKEAVASYTARAAEKLREEKEIAAFITVSITTNYFRKNDKQYANNLTSVLPQPTQYTPILIDSALRALERIFKQGYKYKKAVVGLTGLSHENTVQENLFHPVANSKEEVKLMSVMDSLNKEWGSGTLQYAAQGIQRKWKGKSEQRSQRYTTRWDELPLVT